MNKSKGIKRSNQRRASLVAIVLLLCVWMANSLARQSQEGKAEPILQKKPKMGTQVNINALLHETQKMSQKVNEMTLVWWIPEVFWRLSSAQDPTITETQVEELIKILRPYTLIVVVDGKMGPLGRITYRPEAAIRANIQIKDSEGTYYRPLSEDKVGADTRNLLSIMKPIFVNMSGPMGQNAHLFLFPARNKKGWKIADAKQMGGFSIKLGEKEFRWRLPLGSLLPPKICLKCRENCSGAWNFCPWCGTRLPK